MRPIRPRTKQTTQQAIKYSGYDEPSSTMNRKIHSQNTGTKSRYVAQMIRMKQFWLEISDPTEAETLISQNLACQVTGIVYEVEEFDLQFRSGSARTANVSDIQLKIVGQNKNASSAERIIHTKDAQIEKQINQSVPTVRGHMLHLTKSVPNTKNRHSGNMWSITKKHMPQLLVKTLSHSLKLQIRHLLSQPNSSLNS